MFHVSSREWAAGDVIEAGAWGRLLSAWSFPHNIPKEINVLVWEVALEASRLSLDPSMPSRLNCVFTTESVEAARHFRDRFRAGAKIYEVESVNEADVEIRCDFDLISNSGFAKDALIPDVAVKARRYWDQNPKGLVEILHAGPVRVVRTIEDD